MSEPSKLENYKLKRIGILETGHTSTISQISVFPSSKNYVSVSYDKSIIIWNEDNKVIQKIENAHENEISYVCIKDDNYFATCSYDKTIKFWKKNEENVFANDKNILNAHEKEIQKILFESNGNIISSGSDYAVKVWKLDDGNNYVNIATLKHEEEIYSFLIIEDKNLLISSGVGEDETIFWDLKTYNKISEIKNVTSYTANSMLRLTENIVIISEEDGYKLRFIDIDKKKLVKEINNKFYVFGIYLEKEKGIFLVGGSDGIIIYRINDYKKIQYIENESGNDINGFFEMKNNIIGTFGDNGQIQTWEFQLKNDEDKNSNKDSDEDEDSIEKKYDDECKDDLDKDEEDEY